jgi:uncharacterized membrane protein YjgN (DUF898 family)
MTTLEAAVPPAPAPIAAPAAGSVRFFGDSRSYWRLLIRGAVLLMFTLGIYRFWLATDIRRFLWSGIELSDDSFEYTGTAAELLQGFLMALRPTVCVVIKPFSSSVPGRESPTP